MSMSMSTFTTTLNTADPLMRGRIRDLLWAMANAMDSMALEMEANQQAAANGYRDFAIEYEAALAAHVDELIVTRLFCGVAFAAAQAMIDGTREAP